MKYLADTVLICYKGEPGTSEVGKPGEPGPQGQRGPDGPIIDSTGKLVVTVKGQKVC